MRLTLVTEPAKDVVALQDQKDHLHVDSNDEDGSVSDYIKAATARLDGRDGLLGRCLITQQWKATFDCFPPELILPLPPTQAVDEIVYVDSDGVSQTLATDVYSVFGLGTADGARVRLALGKSWPTTSPVPDAVSVTFTAGYGDDGDDVPESIRTAIKMMAASLYENRASYQLDTVTAVQVPDGAADLLRNYRAWSF